MCYTIAKHKGAYMKEDIHWSRHIEFAVLLVTLLGCFYTLDGKIERQGERQSARTDRLYEMFIELVKEGK